MLSKRPAVSSASLVIFSLKVVSAFSKFSLISVTSSTVATSTMQLLAVHQ
jgi:hypothetical protein